MHKRSFAVGLLTGIVLAILAVAAVPGLDPSQRGRRNATERAWRPSASLPEEPRILLPPAPEPPAALRTEEQPKAVVPEAAPKDMDAEALRRAANEVAARATLRNIISAQAQFQCTARADEDMDGVGEYGSLAELSGAIGVRDGVILNPPVLSTAFRKVSRGRVERSGYFYRIYLPQANGLSLAERDRGGVAAGETNPDLAETCWCAYAWPVEGEGKTYFTNQAGDVLLTSEGGYVGDREPPPYAAFRDASGLAAPTAIETESERHIGADRCEWKQAG